MFVLFLVIPQSIFICHEQSKHSVCAYAQFLPLDKGFKHSKVMLKRNLSVNFPGLSSTATSNTSTATAILLPATWKQCLKNKAFKNYGRGNVTPWVSFLALTVVHKCKCHNGCLHVRQPITGQNGLCMAGLWLAVTRLLRHRNRLSPNT